MHYFHKAEISVLLSSENNVYSGEIHIHAKSLTLIVYLRF